MISLCNNLLLYSRVISGVGLLNKMPDIVSVHYLQENKMKVKLNSNIRPNILSEIMILRENEGYSESLAQISN